MLISEVTSRKAKQPMTVIDCFVGKGLEQGGHSALPDIDSDFASDRRQEIKEYLEERYNVGGKQRVFSAGTFSSLKLKAVLKDVARVYRVPVNIVNTLRLSLVMNSRIGLIYSCWRQPTKRLTSLSMIIRR